MKFKKGKRIIVAVLGLIFFYMFVAGASSFDAKVLSEAKKYLKLSGFIDTVEKTISVSIEPIVMAIKQARPSITEKEIVQYKNSLQKEMTEGLKELAEKTVVLYVNHYSLSELQELNRFYSTSVGKKIRQSTINLTPELSREIQIWNIKMVQKAMLQMQK